LRSQLTSQVRFTPCCDITDKSDFLLSDLRF
jgi:hypothetical protein